MQLRSPSSDLPGAIDISHHSEVDLVASDEARDFIAFAREFVDLHRSRGVSVDLRAYLSSTSTVLVRINGRELSPVSLRQYDAIYGVVVAMNRGKTQVIENTAVDPERKTVRIQKMTFKNGDRSEHSVSNYHFDAQGFLVRIDTDMQAYGADEFQSALMDFLQQPTFQKATTGLELLMRASCDDTSVVHGPASHDRPGAWPLKRR